jgi:hypothetical protein
LEFFLPKHEGLIHAFIKDIPSIRHTLLLTSDLHDYFQNESDAFRPFVIDAIASQPQGKNLQLETHIPFLALLVRFVEHIRNTDVSDQQMSAAWEVDLGEIVNWITNEGLSLEKLKNLVSLFGFQGGHPGRPTKDYSAEYELRAKGYKWREVAEYAYKNRPEIRQEFGASEFGDLARTRRADLMHRVREGIRGYAKRERRPFPSKMKTDTR